MDLVYKQIEKDEQQCQFQKHLPRHTYLYCLPHPFLPLLILHHHHWKYWTEARNFHVEDHGTPTTQNQARPNSTCQSLTVSWGRYDCQCQTVSEKREDSGTKWEVRGSEWGWVHSRSRTQASLHCFKRYTKKELSSLEGDIGNMKKDEESVF